MTRFSGAEKTPFAVQHNARACKQNRQALERPSPLAAQNNVVPGIETAPLFLRKRTAGL
jgi:hypothetical protein